MVISYVKIFNVTNLRVEAHYVKNFNVVDRSVDNPYVKIFNVTILGKNITLKILTKGYYVKNFKEGVKKFNAKKYFL